MAIKQNPKKVKSLENNFRFPWVRFQQKIPENESLAGKKWKMNPMFSFIINGFNRLWTVFQILQTPGPVIQE